MVIKYGILIKKMILGILFLICWYIRKTKLKTISNVPSFSWVQSNYCNLLERKSCVRISQLQSHRPSPRFKLLPFPVNDANERRDDDPQVGKGVPELGEVIGHLLFWNQSVSITRFKTALHCTRRWFILSEPIQNSNEKNAIFIVMQGLRIRVYYMSFILILNYSRVRTEIITLA